MTEDKDKDKQFDDGRDNPYELKAGLIPLLMRYVQVTAWMVIREIVSNAIDQYILPGQENKEPLVRLEVSKYRKILTGRDYATGIQDLKTFKMIGNDFFEGIGKVMSTITGNGSGRIDPRFIGQYHIAKLSYVSASYALSDKVRIYSNNGIKSHILTMRDFGWGDDQSWNNSMQKPVFPETGLMVEILEPRKELLNARTMAIKLSEWFGIKIHRKQVKIKIYDNDRTDGGFYQAKTPQWLKTDNEATLARLKGGGIITGRFDPMMKPTHEKTIYVHVKYVGVTWLQCDYLARGWINCDALTTEMDLSRDRFIQGDLLEEVIEKLNAYFEANGYEKAVREQRTFKNTQKLEELANLAQTIGNSLFDSDVELSGKPAPNNPDNPDEVGNDEKVKKEVEQRDTDTNCGTEESKEPVDKTPGDEKEPRERKPITTHIVNRRGGLNTNAPNVKIKGGNFGLFKPVLYFETAEILHLNFDHDSSKLITTSSPKVQGKIAMFLVAKAVVDFRTKDIPEMSRQALDEKLIDMLDELWRRA